MMQRLVFLPYSTKVISSSLFLYLVCMFSSIPPQSNNIHDHSVLALYIQSLVLICGSVMDWWSSPSRFVPHPHPITDGKNEKGLTH